MVHYTIGAPAAEELMKELMDESWTSWNNSSQSNGIENPDGVIARRGRVKREYYNPISLLSQVMY